MLVNGVSPGPPALLLAALLAASPAPAETPARVGLAYAMDSSELLYREIHQSHWQAGTLLTETVRYTNPAGDTIATKSIDYRPGLLAPAFHLTMTNPLYEEGFKSTAAGWVAFVRQPGAAKLEQAPIERGPELVADAGFDRLIAAKLAMLKAGKTLSFRFLVPSRLTTYAFRVRNLGPATVLDQPALHIRLEPAGFLLRWLADPIEVYYQRDSGRLLRYLGPSNLRDAAGDNPLVRIDFPLAAASTTVE